MSSQTSDIDVSYLLAQRRRLTEELLDDPYNLLTYIARAEIHAHLGYPDLAAGDAYRALLLTDEVLEPSFEYHEQAVEALRSRDSSSPSSSDDDEAEPPVLRRLRDINPVDDRLADAEPEDVELMRLALRAAVRCYQVLSISLLLCGCLKSAFDFCNRGLTAAPHDEDLRKARDDIATVARRRLKVSPDELDTAMLPDHGLVRREVYPWNDHEPDRYSEETLRILNEQLAEVAPKCIVKVSELPLLSDSIEEHSDGPQSVPTVRQLGLFAKEDIEPGENVLDEFSILTANNRLKESLCDACSAELPALGSADGGPIPCDGCEDTMFCSEFCYEKAQELYHPAMCDKDIDTVAKDPDPKETPDALYLLLLTRSLAMALTQEVHPLDLIEVKYIWGDFLPESVNAVPVSPQAGPPPIWTLPFSFFANIAGPLHVLEKLDVDIFATLATHDLWIFNTLYSKFRGTASARVSPRDGRPEVAAVHPLWCLANHDCNPNVQWEWGGRMKLWARKTRIPGSGLEPGLKAGDEVLNHYCDIDLPVKERREWAKGSLGGLCMCERCRTEEQAQLPNGVAHNGA